MILNPKQATFPYNFEQALVIHNAQSDIAAALGVNPYIQEHIPEASTANGELLLGELEEVRLGANMMTERSISITPGGAVDKALAMYEEKREAFKKTGQFMVYGRKGTLDYILSHHKEAIYGGEK